jgi:D-3-phosphoglycerate dehydrogenase
MTPSPKSPRVVVTSRSFSSGTLDLVQELETAGLQVVRAAIDHDLEALRQPLSQAVAWIAGTAPVTAEHFAMAPHLRLVARYGVGVDAVDLAAAGAAHVIVTNTPGANSDAVAEHAIGLLIATLRGIPSGDARLRSGVWSVTRGRQLSGSVAGIVGFGRIGRGAAWRMHGLGCQVLVHDPFVSDNVIREAGFEPASLESIRDNADVVSLHAPGGNTIVDKEWTGHAKSGQTIVNTARGDLVDEDAVADALRSGRLFAYAADTLIHEDPSQRSPLLDTDLADRVVVTPHLGAQTVEAVDRMGFMAVHEVTDLFAGRPPQCHVTLPETEPS